MITHTYPPDAMLYEKAKDYVAAISAEWQSCGVGLAASPNTALWRSREAFPAALRQSHIEFKTAQDILDIATELCSYAERSAF